MSQQFTQSGLLTTISLKILSHNRLGMGIPLTTICLKILSNNSLGMGIPLRIIKTTPLQDTMLPLVIVLKMLTNIKLLQIMKIILQQSIKILQVHAISVKVTKK